MKAVFTLFLVVLVALGCCLDASARHVRVRSYTTRSGHYVRPHYRTSANRIRLDNWSTKGNRNPFTGKCGYKSLFSHSRRSVVSW
jgi:hypothetical protein